MEADRSSSKAALRPTDRPNLRRRAKSGCRPSAASWRTDSESLRLDFFDRRAGRRPPQAVEQRLPIRFIKLQGNIIREHVQDPERRPDPVRPWGTTGLFRVQFAL